MYLCVDGLVVEGHEGHKPDHQTASTEGLHKQRAGVRERRRHRDGGPLRALLLLERGHGVRDPGVHGAT